MSKGLEALKELKERLCFGYYVGEQVETIEKQLNALEIISQNFKLVGNCLHAKNKYAESGWVFVKELENEEEHNAWKEVLL